MPFCAHCGWKYSGEPRFCRDCGRPILRRVHGGAATPATTRGTRPPLRVVGPAVAQETRRELWRGRGLVLGLGLLAGIAFLLVGAAQGGSALGSLPADEAWVRLVYARNLAQSAHLEFNAGQREAGLGSVLWVLWLALLIKTLGAIGLSVVALAKATSLAAAAAAAVLAAEIARRLTASRAAALAAGALVALDPTFGFAAASGVEPTLLAALALGTCLALLDVQPIATGVLLGLAVLTSLEGLVLLPLVALALLVPLALELRRGRRPVREDLVSLALALGPGIVAALVWLWLDAPAGRGPLPQELYAARAARPGPPLPDLVALWRGYVEPAVGLLGPGAWILAFPTIAFGVWLAWRAGGWRALPLVAFAPLLWLGVAATLPLSREPWDFSLRRLADAGLPFVALLLVLGVRGRWREGGELVAPRVGFGSPRRPAWALAAVGVPLVAGLIPLASLLSLWDRMPREYAAAAADANDTYFALARYVRDNLPEQSLVAAIEPGAIRYVSRRPVADLTGVHTPVLAGRPPLDALLDAHAEFAALPRTRLWDSAPGTTLVRDFAPPGDDPSAPRLGLFRMALSAPVAARDAVYAFPTDRLKRLDYADVGSDASEREHAYQIVDPREVVRRTARVAEDRVVAEDGRAWANAESLSLAAEPGRDLVVARRFDGFAPGGFRVTVDGQPVGEWWPRAGSYAIAEDSLRIPGRFVRTQRAVVRLELIAGSAPQATTFAYWSFSDQ